MVAEISFYSPSPVFQNGSTEKMFLENPVYAMISILKTHPLIRPNGARQLVQFLSRLPQPSTIILVDSLNRFNINAFEVRRYGASYTPEQDNKCRKKAMERADEYLEAIKTELDSIEDENEKKKIKLIRWDDIQDSKYETQIKIVERHYKNNPVLKEKIDTIAEGFVRLRLPQAKSVDQRLPFMVKYITQEIPMLVTGHFWEGKHHSLMVYPTDGESKGNIADNVVSSEDDDKPSMRNLTRDVKESPLFEDLRNELIEAIGGYAATTGNVTLPLIAPLDLKKIDGSNISLLDTNVATPANKPPVEATKEDASSNMTKLTKRKSIFVRQMSAAG